MDSKVQVPLRPCKTLDPKDIQVNWSNGGSGDGVVKSSSANMNIANGSSFIHPSNSVISAFCQIDTGSGIIEIVKEEIIQNPSTGILLCAATAKSEDGKGRLLACGTSDHKIVLWRIDAKKNNYLGSFTSHNGWVTCLDFSSIDLCTLLSGSEDHTVCIWDIQEEEKGTKEPQKNVRFSSRYVPIEVGDTGYFLSVFHTEKNTVQVSVVNISK